MKRNASNGIISKPFKYFLTGQAVSKDQNTRETEWLHQEPDKLLTHYQFIVEATVARFISRGFFRAEEKMEVVQEINVELLEKKMARMREQYNGSVYLRTYFSRIIYNSCLEIARGRKRQPQILSTELLAEETSAQLSPIEALAIRDEMHRLEALLKGRRQYYKLKLCFKLWVQPGAPRRLAVFRRARDRLRYCTPEGERQWPGPLRKGSLRAGQ